MSQSWLDNVLCSFRPRSCSSSSAQNFQVQILDHLMITNIIHQPVLVLQSIMIRFLSLVLCLLGTMHPLVAVGIRGTSDESARDLTSSLTCPYGQSVEEALFVMNVTITGATATSQKETLAYLEGAIARFTYIFAESISLDLQVQPMCKNEEEPEDSDYTKISTRRRTQDAVFFFPIGGDCYFCPPGTCRLKWVILFS